MKAIRKQLLLLLILPATFYVISIVFMKAILCPIQVRALNSDPYLTPNDIFLGYLGYELYMIYLIIMLPLISVKYRISGIKQPNSRRLLGKLMRYEVKFIYIPVVIASFMLITLYPLLLHFITF